MAHTHNRAGTLHERQHKHGARGASVQGFVRRLLLPCAVLATLVACASPSTVEHRAAPLAAAPRAAPSNATPAVTGPSRPSPAQMRATANALLRSMTLDQELGQLFIVEYLYGDPQHADLQAMIGDMGAGGVILYQSMNIYGIPQMQQLTQAMQSDARIPLILGADEEGGGDDQTDQIFGSHPTAWDIGSTGNTAVAAQNATRLANELKQLGMNADFAPVVDVLAPGRVWSRSFSHSPAQVAKMGIAQVDAMQAAGVMACPKHFPGLGAATINPHAGLPVIDNSRAYIEEHDLAPYRALMDHQPAMIMTTDLLMPALDRTMPAELSQPIVTGILRNEIGYDGVVVTDALYMGGITDRFSMPEAGVLALQAGNDMLEGAWNAAQMRTMVDALRTAVQSGRLTKARIDESVRRILMLKLTYGLMRPLSLHNVLASAPAAPVMAGDDGRVAGGRPEWRRALV
jgi:beta-N-acetylhexosaminidase